MKTIHHTVISQDKKLATYGGKKPIYSKHKKASQGCTVWKYVCVQILQH